MATLLGLAACEGGGQPGGSGGSGGTDAQIVDSLVLAAEASQASGDWAGATQYWRSLLQRDPQNERYAVGLIDGLRRTGKYGESLQVATEVLRVRPATPALLGALGKAQLASGRRDEAIATLNEASMMDPLDWEVQSALGIAYGMAGQSALADQHYRQALALVPDNPVVLNNYALHLAITDRFDEGLAVMRQAAGIVGAPSQVRQNLALLLAIKGDMGEAEQIVRGELPRDSADRQMAFLSTLATKDMIDLGELVGQSTLGIDSAVLPPPASATSVADLTNVGGAAGAGFLDSPPATAPIEQEAIAAPAPEPDAASEQALQGELLAIETQQELPTPPPQATLGQSVIVTPSAPEDAAADSRSLAEQTAAVSAELAAALGGQAPAVAASPVPTAPADEPLPAPLPPPEPAVSAPPLPPPPDDATPVAAPPPPSAGPWRVQLASLGTEAAAEQGRSRAMAAHAGLLGTVPVAVVAAQLDNGSTTWRVLAGGFADKANAVDLCERIKAEGGDCFVMNDGSGG